MKCHKSNHHSLFFVKTVIPNNLITDDPCNIIHVPVIKYNSHMTVTLTTVKSIFFNQQNTFGKVIHHVNNNPTIYQLYGPQSGLEKKKK